MLSTGDELADAGARLTGKIRDSNRITLLAAVAAAGGEPLDLGIAPDDQEQLEAKVRQGLAQADIVVTSGGVSMGNLDFIKPLLERAGTVHFGRLRMKPGKPLTFATVRGGWAPPARVRAAGQPGEQPGHLLFARRTGHPQAGWLGRPGVAPRAALTWRSRCRLTPIGPSTIVSCYTGMLPRMAGMAALSPPARAARPAAGCSSMRSANALLELPAGSGVLPVGTPVDALLIRRTVSENIHEPVDPS